MIQTDDPMKLIVTYSHWRNKIMNEQKIADISTLTTSLYCLHSWLHYNPEWKRRFYKQSHSVPVSGCLVNVKVNLVRIKTIYWNNSSSWHHPRHCFLCQILSVLSGKKYHQLSERKVWHHSGQEELRCSGYRPARLSEQDRPSLLCLLDSLARKVMRNIPSL